MKKAHYCDTCHSFVWRPEILDIHYNAQQRGHGEEDCSYGLEHDRKDHHGERDGRFSDMLRKSGKKSQNNSSHEEVYGSSAQKTAANRQRAGTSDTNQNKRKAGGCLAKIILVLIILNAVIGSIGSNLLDFFTGDDFRYRIENVLDEFGIEDDIPIWESESEAADADEIKDANENEDTAVNSDTGYLGSDDISYFEMTKDELEEFIFAWSNTEYGRTVQKIEDNVEQEGTYVDEDGNEYHVPEIGTYYSMGENRDCIALYSECDTSQVKAVTAMFEDEDRVKDFGIMAASVLDPEGEYNRSDWEAELSKLINQVKEENAGESDHGYVSKDIDDMIVTASKFASGEICLTFEAMDFQ